MPEGDLFLIEKLLTFSTFIDNDIILLSILISERYPRMNVDYSKKWYVMAAVACGIFLSTIDGSIVNIALNTLVEELHEPLAVVEWVVLAYLLVIATLMLSIGRLADMFGKKKLYAAGLAIFTLGSLFCGLSTNIVLLITSRVFQAIGASMSMAIGTAIVTESFPPQERGKALGMTGLFVSIGVIAGPTLGGIILQHLSWHWLFFVNLPVGLVGFILVLLFVPDFKPNKKQKFDFIGAGTMFVALASFLLALSFVQINGFKNPFIYPLLVLSVVMVVLFLRAERKAPEPMVDLKLFGNHLFTINLLTCLLTFIASSGITLLLPLFLQNVKGFDMQTTGLLMIISPMAMALVAPISGSLSDRMELRKLTTIGLSVALIGYLLLITFSEKTSLFVYVITFIATGAGMGFFQAPNNSAVMGSAPKERLGVASGLLSLTRTLGQTVGISILGAVWEANVLFQAANQQISDATQAPITAQVGGLHIATAVSAVFIILALLFSAWALISVTRAKKAAASQ